MHLPVWRAQQIAASSMAWKLASQQSFDVQNWQEKLNVKDEKTVQPAENGKEWHFGSDLNFRFSNEAAPSQHFPTEQQARALLERYSKCYSL